MFNLVKMLHEKFNISYQGKPRQLPDDEFDFRMTAFDEEICEYADAREAGDLEGQMDALLDLLVFTLGACEKHGFSDIEEAFKRVMKANMNKVLVESAAESKRGHKFDLKKPEGWRAPYLKDLIYPQQHTGLIVLEGPDGCGKTTLAEFLKEKYNAHVMHSTWSPGLEERMDEYMIQTLEQAYEISKNQLVVLDRHWLSELVYADVFRGGSKRSDLHNYVHNVFQGIGAKIVYCLPRDSELIRQCFNELKHEREEMYDNIDSVIKAYESLWDGSFSRYHFKTPSTYISNILADGGFSKVYYFLRYDWMTDGKNMDDFVNSNDLIEVKA